MVNHPYTHPHPTRFTDDHAVVEHRRHPRLARVLTDHPAPQPPAHNPTYDAVVKDHGFDPLRRDHHDRTTP